MSHANILRSIEEGSQLSGYQKAICTELSKRPKSIVILDDDPTGTQTVYNIPVITEWSEETLERELLASRVFFILTNSRSLQMETAIELAKLIGQRLKKISDKLQKKILVVSRSDSTLRGHYPDEVNALLIGLGLPKAKHIVAPAFFDGGRYTYEDIHYVKEGNAFIPVGETPFAKDNTFGYKSSNLRDWILEKSNGHILPSQIESIPVNTLRKKSTKFIKKLLTNPETTHFAVNATSDSDLQAVALVSLKLDIPLIFRTGASFVNALSGIKERQCLTKNEIFMDSVVRGALVVIGSYVPKTNQQLEYLMEKGNAVFVELDVSKVLEPIVFQRQLTYIANKVDSHLEANKDVVLYTSRKILKGTTKVESLDIVNMVSNGLISIVQKLSNQPRYILAKGGITSSDVATKGLSVRRAKVLGQVIKGVPVWLLNGESKFPGMPYIVFPGNVGDRKALYELVEMLK